MPTANFLVPLRSEAPNAPITLNNSDSLWATVTLISPAGEERRYTLELLGGRSASFPNGRTGDTLTLSREAALLFDMMRTSGGMPSWRAGAAALQDSYPATAVAGRERVASSRVNGHGLHVDGEAFVATLDPATGVIRVRRDCDGDRDSDRDNSPLRRFQRRVSAFFRGRADPAPLNDVQEMQHGARAGANDKKTRDDVVAAVRQHRRGIAHISGLAQTGLLCPAASELDLSGWDLAGEDLTGCCLDGANLCNANLAGADLHSVTLRGANLTGANLARARLDEANLGHAFLCGANMAGANLAGAWLAGAHLNGADLRQADLTHAALPQAELYGADLTGARLRFTNLTGASLVDGKLAEADLFGARLECSVLTGATLRSANLRNIIVGTGQCLATMTLGGTGSVAAFGLNLEALTQHGGVDRVLDHRNNGTGLLLNIDAMRDDVFKVSAMEQIISMLDTMAVQGAQPQHEAAMAGARQCALDVLIPNPLYRMRAPSIGAFISRCCLEIIRQCNDMLLPAHVDPQALTCYMREAQTRALSTPGFARLHGIGIMQLVFRGRHHSAAMPELGQRAENLAAAYFSSLPEGLQRAVAYRNEEDGESYFPLLASGNTGIALLMSSDYFRNRILRDALPGGLSQMKWEMLWTCQPAGQADDAAGTGSAEYVSSQVGSLRAAFESFPLLLTAYQADNRGAMRQRYLTGMRLGAFEASIAAALEAPNRTSRS
jgi:uncharacterized protein YjbI with pentapeptide repeats